MIYVYFSSMKTATIYNPGILVILDKLKVLGNRLKKFFIFYIRFSNKKQKRRLRSMRVLKDTQSVQSLSTKLPMN